MALIDHDEQSHTADADPRWQENLLFCGLSYNADVSFLLHLCHRGADETTLIKAAVTVKGQTVSCTLCNSSTSCYRAPELSVDVVEPFRRMGIRFNGRGSTTKDEFQFSSTEHHIPFGFSITIESHSLPIELNHGGRKFPWAVNHYELGGEFKGSFWVGAENFDCVGLMVRDHTWGVRDWKFDEAWWHTGTFTEARRLIAGCTVVTSGSKSSHWLSSSERNVEHLDEEWQVPEPEILIGRCPPILHKPWRDSSLSENVTYIPINRYVIPWESFSSETDYVTIIVNTFAVWAGDPGYTAYSLTIPIYRYSADPPRTKRMSASEFSACNDRQR
ncbi:hypothetical protein [Nocardia sp. NPDC052316]|uniref:hypothetical protein n=1 Tax=Nocardia sp. NPDC052316 TaxID=3364329 RepID=UPI0037C74AA3